MTKNYISILGKASKVKSLVDRESVIAALKTVEDPELFINIYDLGFIYDIEIDDFGNIEVTMTLTAPGCPVADILPIAAANSVLGVAGVGEVKVALVWDPPWSLDKVSDEVKELIEFF